MKTKQLFPVVTILTFSLLATTLTANADPAQMLQAAAKKGQVEQIREALAAGANVNARFDIGRTALIIAAKGGRVAAVEALMDAGSDWYLLDNNGWDALAHATVEPHVPVVRTMLRKGYDPAMNDWRVDKVIAQLGYTVTTNPKANQIREARDIVEGVRRHGPRVSASRSTPSTLTPAAAPATLQDDDSNSVRIDISDTKMTPELFKMSATRAFLQRGWQILNSESDQITATLTKRDMEYRARITHQPGEIIKIAFIKGFGATSPNWLNNLKRDIEIEINVAATR